jgi:murein DD-endopeptidase MepM/ murein hydrolase activator NlpD
MLAQGVGGAQSHQGANRYSFDFSMPEGTPVLAARSGVVVFVKDGFERSGLDPALQQQANTVVVLHEDESFASYGHLLPGIEVRVGQRVERGEQLGRSGATGYAAGPHLHFQVGMALERYDDRFTMPVRFDDDRVSVPIRFDDGSAEGIVPEEGRRYGPAR